MTTRQKLNKAVLQYQETATECYEVEAIQAFAMLFSMLGEEELFDGIATAMQDEGYEETYEEIIYYYREL